MVNPSVQFKAVEGYALAADTDLGQVWPDLGVEAIAVHAEIARGITKAEQSRHNGGGGKVVAMHGMEHVARRAASEQETRPRCSAIQIGKKAASAKWRLQRGLGMRHARRCNLDSRFVMAIVTVRSACVLWIKLFAVNNFIHRMHFMSADYRTRATSLIRQEIDVNGRAAIAEHRLQILETVQPFAHRRP